MSSHGEPNPLLLPRQFRLSSVFVVITVCAGLLSLARLAPSPLNATIALICGGCLTALVAYMVRAIVRESPQGSGLFGGAMGSMLAGTAYPTLVLLFVVAQEKDPLTFINFLLGLWIFVMLAPSGMMWFAAFVVLGLGAGWCLIRWRGRDGTWTGVVCGAVTGYFAVTVPMLVILPFQNVVSTSELLFALLIGLTSAAVTAAYGGFGAAMRLAGARDQARRRAAVEPVAAASTSPIAVDECLQQTALLSDETSP